jgi:hypothetical protein
MKAPVPANSGNCLVDLLSHSILSLQGIELMAAVLVSTSWLIVTFGEVESTGAWRRRGEGI